MLEFKIARRFLWRSKVQSLLIVLGIAVGIAVQVFVGSLITTLQASLVETTVGSSAHVTMQPTDGEPALAFGMRGTATPRVPSGSDGGRARADPFGSRRERRHDRSAEREGRRAAHVIDTIYRLSGSLTAGETTLQGGRSLVGNDARREVRPVPGRPVRSRAGDGTRPASHASTGIVDLGSAAANLRTAFTGPELPRAELGYRARPGHRRSRSSSATRSSPSRGARVGSASSAVSRSPTGSPEQGPADGAADSQSASRYMIQVFVLVAVGARHRVDARDLGRPEDEADRHPQGARHGRRRHRDDLPLAVARSWDRWARRSASGSASCSSAGFTLGPSEAAAAVPDRPANRDSSPSRRASGSLVALLSAIIPTRKTARLDPIEVIQNG